MTGEGRTLAWLIPGLMTATLALVGWIGLNINRMSESLAVVAYRLEAQSVYVKDMNNRVRTLELYAAIKSRKLPEPP